MKTKLGILALSVTTAFGANANTQNTEQSQPPAPVQYQEQTITFKNDQGFMMASDFTPEELQLLRQKKDVLIKYLYEQEQLEKLRSVLKEEERRKNWESTKESSYPLTPQEVIELRKLSKNIEESQNKPLQNIKNQIRTVNLDVGASEPVTINVVKGLASSVVFYDETGAPWPIEGEIIGDVTAFKRHKIGDRQNIAGFEVVRNFAESNALIHLKGLDVSIVIRLVGSDTVNDSRLSVRIPKPGPHAKLIPVATQTVGVNDPLLVSVANGEFIQNSKRYEIEGVEATAFFKDGYLYIRSKHQLVIPLPKEAQTTPSGYLVYKVPATEDFLFLVDGEMIEASIKESFDVKIKHKSSLFK
ncbi:hypothetical protein DC888_24220 [Vibrio parahaemolyticus]|nr:hypothetical protein [Vibrio parahaemolyticus]